MSNDYSSISSNSERALQELLQNIAHKIRLIQKNVSAIRQLIVKIVRTNNDLAEYKSQILALRERTRPLIKETNSNLNDLATKYIDSNLQLHRERLVDTFTSAITAFRHTEEEEKRALLSTSNNLIDLHYPEYNGNTQPCTDQHGQSQSQLLVDNNQILLLQEQLDSVKQLEKDVQIVNEIIQELGKLVHDQGEAVDTITERIDETAINVEHGTESLRKANLFQTSYRKKKIIIILVLLLVTAVIIAVLCWTSKK